MTAVLVALVFFGGDLALVTAGLLWLSHQRARSDPTDMRWRDPRRWHSDGQR